MAHEEKLAQIDLIDTHNIMDVNNPTEVNTVIHVCKFKHMLCQQ